MVISNKKEVPKKSTDQSAKKSPGELKIFKTRKEVKTPPADKADSTAVKPNESTKNTNTIPGPNRARHRSPAKILKRFLSPQRSIESTTQKTKSGVRDVQPPPTIEIDPDEGKLKISNGNSSAQKVSQTVVMSRKSQHHECQVHVVSRKKSVDSLNGSGPKLRNEFYYPQRSSICATFTLDRSKKLATIGQPPRSAGLVSQHQNSAFTSSSTNPLNARSMSSHHLLSQLNQQQMPSASSTTLNNEEIEVVTSTDSTPIQSTSPPENTIVEEHIDRELVADPQEAMIESVHAKTANLAEKLSRSFFDLTQGSSDRLAKWKSKLQKYGQRSTEKETNSASRRMASLDGSVPGSDVVVNWQTSTKSRRNPPQPPPRPLHSSRSATNALSHGLSLESTLPLGRGQHSNTSTLPHSLHKSASVREADTLIDQHRVQRKLSPHTVSMEHRTLKPRENVLGHRSPIDATTRAQHMRSLHELVQSIEGFQQNSAGADKSRNSTITLNSTRGVISQDCGVAMDVDLPPPAKIMPYSGIKPQDNGIIRPIAFRPLATNSGLKHSNRHSNSPDTMPSFYNRSNLTTIEQHKQALKDCSRSIGNLNNLSAPRSARNPLHQPSTSSTTLFGCKSIGSLNADENAYDVVPEYLNEPAADANYSSIYPFHAQQHSNRALSQNAPKRQQGSLFSNGTNSSQFTNSSNSSGSTTSPNNKLKKSISGSQQNVQQGHSNGAHITPSPSDSGILLADYESLIREKESELQTVRQAMEQNEEVLIRVYQEKERQFKIQVDELKQKLQHAQQGESDLRKKLRQSDEYRQQLQRKCEQIERELTQLKTRLDEQRPNCDSCRRGHQQTQSIYENNCGIKPIPAPRLMNKEHDLRSEVDDLKSEVSMLRDQLNKQVEFFADERKRWEQNHLSPCPSDSSRLNNNLPKPTTHFSTLNFGQQRALNEKRPILTSTADRLI